MSTLTNKEDLYAEINAKVDDSMITEWLLIVMERECIKANAIGYSQGVLGALDSIEKVWGKSEDTMKLRKEIEESING